MAVFSGVRDSSRRIGAAAAILTLIVAFAGADIAYAVTATNQYVEGEVLVTFKPGIDLSLAKNALTEHSLALAKHFAFLSRQQGRHFGLIRDKNRTTASLIAELAGDPAILSVEPNYLRWVSAHPPNDSLFPSMWGLQNTGQSANGVNGTAGADIKFMNAWALSHTGTNVVVAVIDTGIDPAHSDLASNLWVNPGEISGNGLDDDGNGYVDDVHGYDFVNNTGILSDSGFHGTHVSGTIAAVGNNHLGVIGVNYQARIMMLKVSGDGNSIDTAAEIEAIQYGTMMRGRGANIVAMNASFGGGGFNSVESSAIQAAGNAGIIFCVAAGNNAANLDSSPDYPASYHLGNMIVIAASDQNDHLASFSNYGSGTADLAAPGVNILSTAPTNIATLAQVTQGTNLFSGNPMTYSGTTPGNSLTATVYYCGLGNPADFPPGVSNNIALISRGTLTFASKVSNAMAAGARAALIYNNASGNYLGTLGSQGNWIPAYSLSQADGLTLQALSPTNATFTIIPYQYLDGTSMATPHVVGAVAFAAMNFPGESVTNRIQRVLTNVDIVPSLSGLVRTGGRLNLQRLVDTDANGLPDWWESVYFGHLTGTNPNADPDHDGASNLAEFLAGTVPTNTQSSLRLTPFKTNSLGVVTIQWPSVAGKFYRLQRSTNLTLGFDTLVQTNIAATPPTNTISDTTAPFSLPRFYRLQLEQ